MSHKTLQRFEWFWQFFSQKYSTIQGRVQKTALLGLTNLVKDLFPEMDGFCWITFVPGGVLIKPLSCCWETKLYNQWIKNSFLRGNREGRVGRVEAMPWDAGSFPPWHGRANSSSSTLETFHLVFFRHSSLLKSATLVLLLEAAQRPGISASDAFIPPLVVLPFSASAQEPLDLAVECGQGTAGSRGDPECPTHLGPQDSWGLFIHSILQLQFQQGAQGALHHKPSSPPLEWISSCTQSSCQCFPFRSVFCVAPVAANTESVWPWDQN